MSTVTYPDPPAEVREPDVEKRALTRDIDLDSGDTGIDDLVMVNGRVTRDGRTVVNGW